MFFADKKCAFGKKVFKNFDRKFYKSSQTSFAKLFEISNYWILDQEQLDNLEIKPPVIPEEEEEEREEQEMNEEGEQGEENAENNQAEEEKN